MALCSTQPSFVETDEHQADETAHAPSPVSPSLTTATSSSTSSPSTTTEITTPEALPEFLLHDAALAQRSVVVSPFEQRESIPRIKIKIPKCVRQKTHKHWYLLHLHYVHMKELYYNIVAHKYPYSARMRMHTYRGFFRLFSAFAKTCDDVECVNGFHVTYKQFDAQCMNLLQTNLISRFNNSSSHPLTSPIQSERVEKVRKYFPTCKLSETEVLSIPDTNVFTRLAIPGNEDARALPNEYMFDLLWRYTYPGCAIRPYARYVVERICYVINHKYYYISHYLLLFFIYSLKMVSVLVEFSARSELEALGDDAERTHVYRSQLKHKLNATFIKVFQDLSQAVTAVHDDPEQNYEAYIRKEFMRLMDIKGQTVIGSGATIETDAQTQGGGGCALL